MQIKIFEGKDPKTRKQVVAFPDAIPLQVPASNESISQLEELKVKVDQLDQKRANLSEWEIIAREGISKLQKFRYSKPLTNVVVNTWEIDMLVNPELHYIKSHLISDEPQPRVAGFATG